MPWRETHVEDERVRFIGEWLSGEYTLSALCREFGIARKTGRKWRDRYVAEQLDGLAERSHRPLSCPHAMAPQVRQAVLDARGSHPRWGARKLKAWLEAKDPEQGWPAASSIGELLAREGLTVCRRRRRAKATEAGELAAIAGANSVWCADFKGWFRCGDGSRCDPFTLLDADSRFLLRCQAVARTDGLTLLPLFEAVFRQWGLPEVIRTDNGAPFASTGFGGLTALSIYWIKLGIRPERIAPGRPQQNGRLERLHRTLKAETAQPSAASLPAQQRRFDRWRREYNEERPHEALGQRPPASCYEPAARRLPVRVPSPTYPADVVPRPVNKGGCIRWRGLIDVGQALAGETCGWQALDGAERYWRLFFGRLPLAVFDTCYSTWVPDKEAKAVVKAYVAGPTWHW